MKAQKDRHLDAPGEANRDKHINFLAEEMGDVDPADEKFDTSKKNENSKQDTMKVDNGFFTDDNNSLQTKEESEKDKRNHPSAKSEKVSPAKPDKKTTLADKITVANKNEDILTPVKDDDNTDYTNNAHQAG
jgi:hypothetical protein